MHIYQPFFNQELIQNTDDAGARNISFCLDLRHHNAKLIASTSLVQFQGPSLLVYNDAVFTKEDFKSIQRIGDSLKKTSDTKTKIGRFGIGFNAIYHLTDLPSFVSSTSLVMFDPQVIFQKLILLKNAEVDHLNKLMILLKPSSNHFKINFIHT